MADADEEAQVLEDTPEAPREEGEDEILWARPSGHQKTRRRLRPREAEERGDAALSTPTMGTLAQL